MSDRTFKFDVEDEKTSSKDRDLSDWGKPTFLGRAAKFLKVLGTIAFLVFPLLTGIHLGRALALRPDIGSPSIEDGNIVVYVDFVNGEEVDLIQIEAELVFDNEVLTFSQEWNQTQLRKNTNVSLVFEIPNEFIGEDLEIIAFKLGVRIVSGLITIRAEIQEEVG